MNYVEDAFTVANADRADFSGGSTQASFSLAVAAHVNSIVFPLTGVTVSASDVVITGYADSSTAGALRSRRALVRFRCN